MTDLILRFPDDATAAGTLPQFRGVDPDGNPTWLTASHQHALDPIGPMVLTPAVVDDQGTVTTPATVDDGFHVNLILDGHPDEAAILAAVEPYRITPTRRRRVWA